MHATKQLQNWKDRKDYRQVLRFLCDFSNIKTITLKLKQPHQKKLHSFSKDSCICDDGLKANFLFSPASLLYYEDWNSYCSFVLGHDYTFSGGLQDDWEFKSTPACFPLTCHASTFLD